MQNELMERIIASPKYQHLVKTRSAYGWLFTAMIVVVYFGFIGVIAFNKELFSQRLGEGVMTVGIPVGLGVIVFTIVVTGIYVRRANSEFDKLTEEIIEECTK